jgi:hypothetical protein
MIGNGFMKGNIISTLNSELSWSSGYKLEEGEIGRQD